MRGYKFLNLAKYFRQCSKEKITLTFEQIEMILGLELPKSAYKHRAYWSKSKTHVFPNSWLNAGYKLNSINLKEKNCSFLKENLNIYVGDM